MIKRLATRPTLLVAVFGVALALRMAAGFVWQASLPEGGRFGFADSESYWALAQSIVRGQPYQFGSPDARVFRTPGYPVVLAGLFCVVGQNPPVMWARGLSALLGTVAVGGVACLAWRLFDSRTALLAACMTALYPGAIAMSTFVLSEAPFCVLMLLQLIFWTESDRATSGVRAAGAAVLAGAAAGAASLVRPSWLLFPPFAAAVQLSISRRRAEKAVVSLLMLAAMAAVMSPWWVRNWRVIGRFVPTTLQVGASLYDGLNPHASGASNMDFVIGFHRALKLADARAASPPADAFEWRLDRRLKREAVVWTRNNPGRVLQLMGVKFRRMWNLWPNAAELSSWPLRLLVMVGYAPLVLCGLWGGWRFVGRGWPYALCLLPAVYFTAIHVVFVSSIRYRQPPMLPLIVLAAGAVVSVWRPPPRMAAGDQAPPAASTGDHRPV